MLKIEQPRKVTVLGAFSAASGISIDAELVSDVPETQQAHCALSWLSKHADAWLRLAGVSEDAIAAGGEDLHVIAHHLAHESARRSKNEPVDVMGIWNQLSKPRAGMEAAARVLLPTKVVDDVVDLAKVAFLAAHQHAQLIDPELAARLADDLMVVADACVTEMVTGEKPAPPPEPLPQIDVSDLAGAADDDSSEVIDDPGEDLEGEEG